MVLVDVHQHVDEATADLARGRERTGVVSVVPQD
jgi:hypothetical protein